MSRVLGWVEGFARFWYDFVIGDDWTIAAGVLVGLAATWGLHDAGVAAWWLLPLVCVGVLTLAVKRAQARG